MAIMQLNVFAGYEKQIIIPPAALADTWDITAGYLYHKLNVKSTTHKYVPTLKDNTVYKITYEVFDYVSCSVYLKVGTQEGQVRTANGIYTESFLVSSDSDKTLTFVADGVMKIRAISYEEKTITTTNIPFTDPEKFENKSWTLSYSFYSNTWISWHSYMPLYYIHNQSNFYSFIGDAKVWKHNIEGFYQNFYGQRYPFIVEYVPSKTPISTDIWEDLTFITEARRWDNVSQQYRDERFLTFNKLTAYTSRGSTGELAVKVKDTMPQPEDWYFHQLQNVPGEILITRKERDWNLNELRDYTVDPAQPLFTKSWDKLKLVYYADKIVNSANINYLKNWDELEMLRDKFMIVRLKFDNFDDVNLIFNYSLETEQDSNR